MRYPEDGRELGERLVNSGITAALGGAALAAWHTAEDPDWMLWALDFTDHHISEYPMHQGMLVTAIGFGVLAAGNMIRNWRNRH